MGANTAIEKALKILLEFNHQKDECGIFEISESLNLSKPTTSRIWISSPQ
jgi:DNA-binding IclR family transcriptional regulator